ncbi:hypothetical protein D9757_014587 [Collybiopsis confluens]|uniref:Uncharacterized protein n=1 Tax=Collybiopsis confluens TaxID=2823264 RepID=A0A8H5FMV3_9AGAR|nr:hypothetical protein D9757_014587 [Collybiopsis confluens]
MQMRLDHSPSPPPAPLPAAQIVPPAPIAESARIALKPSRSGRTRYLPARFQDNLPTLSRTMPGTFQPEEEIEDPPPPAQSPAPTPPLSPEPEPVFTEVRTKPDRFGLFQIYSELPEFIPDEEVPIEDVCEGAGFPVSPPADTTSIFSSVIKPLKENIIAPFLNITVWRLMAWWYSSETKSIADLDRLVKEVIRPDEFEPSHLEDFSTKKVLREMDEYQANARLFPTEDGWQEISVDIPVPCSGFKKRESDAPCYTISGIFIRKPLEVMKSTFQSSSAKKFHYTPSELHQQSFPGSDTSIRLHGELYNSPMFINEHKKVLLDQYKKRMAAPMDKDLQHPCALAGMMFWSDATRVGHWGDASMWPIYMYFGNQSKYERSKPSAFAAHHVAYIPKLPDDFKAWYLSQYGCTPADKILTFMRREIPHAIYAKLFDEEFMKAYRDGIILTCGNNLTYCMFPRLFTWSADYPEKMLLVCCKCLGIHPCGECCIKKEKINLLGTVRDKITRIKLERVDSDFRRSSVERARRIIFEKGYSVSSKAVENLLGDYSWTSTRNTFSTLFYEFGFNFYNIIVSDVLHEIELGVWKAVLTHLIRILTSVGSLSLEEMNQRFRRIPTFGRDTIRKINKNVSLMQNLAARDYEDFLQVSLPVFEGLFGTHNKNVQHLLFDLNAVHSFAKLRLHSDPTLDVLDRHTSQLGKSLRVFKNHVCPAFSTKELAKEAGARQRRQAKDQQKRGSTLRSKKAAQTPNKKVFSLSTYKIHALGSYARFIRMFGTTDSYSTQVGELEHRRIKRFYSRTNKVFRYVRQVTGHERRVRIIQSIKQRLEDRNSTAPRVPFQHKDPLLVTDPRTHYHISMDRSLFYNISRWTEEHEHDLSVKHFLRKLKIHLFCRLTTQNDSGDISLEDRSQVIIDSNRMYLHKVLRINYTSYDLRRCQDSINARTHSDIMVLSPDSDDDEHPYLYARVIGIYHVNASLQDEPLKQMDFLWVRWYAMEDNQSCWKTKRLPEVGFIDSTDDQAFGFIDPAHVIRAVHLLPNFDVGQVSDILGPSIARRSDEEDQDYSRYYINIFADRDMVIRFCPDLTLGAHIATSIPMEYASSDVESEEEVDEEELGEEEDDEDEIEIASRAGSADSDQDSVESDKYVDGEWSDFGYDNGDSSNDEEQENERDAIDGPNIGPEDGEEPFNHDVEVLDTEGYAVL